MRVDDQHRKVGHGLNHSSQVTDATTGIDQRRPLLADEKTTIARLSQRRGEAGAA
ncbi:MAG TPA: hypothetical protein VFV66_19450 [Nonomuraea sp.]|nr:hypothetical protein [Nonomuraea sp.]